MKGSELFPIVNLSSTCKLNIMYWENNSVSPFENCYVSKLFFSVRKASWHMAVRMIYLNLCLNYSIILIHFWTSVRLNMRKNKTLFHFFRRVRKNVTVLKNCCQICPAVRRVRSMWSLIRATREWSCGQSVAPNTIITWRFSRVARITSIPGATSSHISGPPTIRLIDVSRMYIR